MRRHLLVGLALFAAGFGWGCNMGRSVVPNYTAQLMTHPAGIPAGAIVIFQATTNDPNGVKWTLSPASGGGTLSNIQNNGTSSTATYQAPASAPSPNSVTVEAVPASNATAGQSDVFTIQPTIGVSIASKITTATALTYASSLTLNATVTNDATNAGVQWALLSGNPPAPCAPACGTLTSGTTSQVTYTPPAAVPAAPGNAATLTATSIADGTKSDSDSFTIQYPVSSLSLLNGVYSFGISGFDSTGHPMGMAGSFTAKGDGTISNVSLDVNDNKNVSSGGGPALGGTYTIASDFTGTITLDGTISGVAHNPSFAFALGSDGTLAQIMSFDANGYVMGGYLLKCNAAQFGLSPIGGAYGLTLNSSSPNRTSTIGRFFLDGSGDITTGFADSSQAGTGPIATDSTLTGTFSAIDSASGRGTASMNLAGTVYDYAVYVVSSNRLLFLETDTASGQLQSGVAERGALRPLPSDNGTCYFAIQGLDTASGSSGSMSALGILTISNGVDGSLVWDSNDAGVIHSSLNGMAATITYAQVFARGTVSIPGGAAAGLFDSAVFYLTTSSNGFILDTTPGTANKGLEGPMHPIHVGNDVPLGSPLIIGGNLLLAEAGPPGILDASSSSNPGAVGLINASGGVLSGNMSVRTIGKPDLIHVPLAGSFQSIDPNTGRGTATIPGVLFGQPGNVPGVFYVGSQNLFVILCTAPGVKTGLVGFNPQ